KKYTGKYVAYGAGAGLLLGSLLGKSGLGGLLGAGAGYVLGRQKDQQQNRNIVLREGLQFGVRLDKDTQIEQELAQSDEPDQPGKATRPNGGGPPTPPRLPDSGSPGPAAPGGESPGAAPGGDRSTSAPPPRPAGHEPDDEDRAARPPSPRPGRADGDVAGSRV